MKTYTIELNNVKSSDEWSNLAFALKFDKFKEDHPDLEEDELSNLFYENVISKIFRYGEYANIKLEVDEDFNIVGGKIF